MTRAVSACLAAGLLVAVACSRPEPETKPMPEPPAATATPAARLIVRVVATPGSGGDAWAKELRAAVGERTDELELAADDGAADFVVRINKVQRDAKFSPEPPGEGETLVMRGGFVRGDKTREFTLGYRGEVRPQAEALARNLRAIERSMSAPVPESAEPVSAK
jgi:hypothetical protein